MRRSVAVLTALATTALTLSLAGPSPAAPAVRAGVAVKGGAPSLAALPSTSEVGRKVTLKGQVGSKAGEVKIQRRYGKGKWTTLDKVTTDGQGKFKEKVKLVDPGPTSFRVTQGATKTRARTVTVSGWLDLTVQPSFVSGDAGLALVPLSIGGKRFPRAFHSFGSSVRTFDLGDACTKVEGWTGFVDGSGATAGDRQALSWTSFDDIAAAQDPAVIETAPGPAVRRTLDVSGDDQLFLNLDVQQSGGTEQSVLGGPRAWCDVPVLGNEPVELLK